MKDFDNYHIKIIDQKTKETIYSLNTNKKLIIWIDDWNKCRTKKIKLK